jgi:hypothetical protein
MRRILVISALAAASALTLTVSTSPVSAAARYCLQGAGWGYPGNCQFRTFAQCRASASGTTAGCGLNPRYAYARQMRSQQPPPPMNYGGNNFGWNNSGWNNSGWNNYGNPNNRGGLVGGSDSGTFRP